MYAHVKRIEEDAATPGEVSIFSGSLSPRQPVTEI